MSRPSWRRVLFRHRVAAGVEHRFYLEHVGPVATVIDIGANRGQFALAVRDCLPHADVVSIEPLETPAGVYQEVFKGDGKTSLVVGAVGPDKGSATMHISARDDSSSLLSIGELQTVNFPGTGEVSTATVEVGPLSHFVDIETLLSPRLLKLDVQGFELEALRGCEDQLDLFTWVYVECSFVELYQQQGMAHEVIQWLGDHGFNLSGVYNVSDDANGIPIQADFAFVNSKHEVH